LTANPKSPDFSIGLPVRHPIIELDFTCVLDKVPTIARLEVAALLEMCNGFDSTRLQRGDAVATNVLAHEDRKPHLYLTHLSARPLRNKKGMKASAWSKDIPERVTPITLKESDKKSHWVTPAKRWSVLPENGQR